MASKTSHEEHLVKPQKKVYPRKLTDKRREQNRQAQKNYRERQKRRIEELEKQIEEKHQTSTSTAAIPPTGPPLNSAPAGPASPAALHDTAMNESLFPTPTASDITFQPFEAGEVITGPVFGDFELEIRGVEGSSFEQAQDEIFQRDETALLPVSSSEANGLWPSPPISESLDEMLGEQIMPAALQANVIESNDAEQAVQNRQPSTALVHSPAHSGPTSPMRRSVQPAFLDNHIVLAPDKCMGAFFEVAASLGITQESYINDYESPFYSPHILKSTSLPINTVARIDADSYSYLKPDLRPSPTQVTFPHCSYLDCIVWPRFRERALRAAIDNKLDHAEFFMDALNDGIVCWGNQQIQRGKGMDRGVTWDQRSWEARPWFIKKWAWLVGGEDDEVARGSKWWRFMRGERDD